MTAVRLCGIIFIYNLKFPGVIIVACCKINDRRMVQIRYILAFCKNYKHLIKNKHIHIVYTTYI